MARKKQLVIPVFIPFGGCTHRCVFCDQANITGAAGLPTIEDAGETIEKYLKTWNGRGRREVAFFGGSFTGLAEETQKAYLECAKAFLDTGRIDGIRVSTRPDYVTEDNTRLLARCGVDTVELGVQSMSVRVLKLSGRGHGVADTVEAMRILKAAGMATGVQIMPGLPGDTVESIIDTACSVLALAPDFARVYPTLVIEGTPLHRMYLSGDYWAWSLDDMVSVCAKVAAMFRSSGVPVIRFGLHTSEGLARAVVAGPYHDSFRQLVEAQQVATQKVAGVVGYDRP